MVWGYCCLYDIALTLYILSRELLVMTKNMESMKHGASFSKHVTVLSHCVLKRAMEKIDGMNSCIL